MATQSKKLVPTQQLQENKPLDNYRIPLVDILERDAEYIIEADMPGTKEENINVQVHHGELSILGKVDRPDKETRKNIYRSGQAEPLDFYRAFRLGETLNTDKITAEYQNGVLTVHLPKAEEHKPRKIEVAKKCCAKK